MELSITALMENEKESFRIREYLRKVDRKFYHRAIENRKRASEDFPYRGEDGKAFANTYKYVSLFKDNKMEG